MIVPIRYGQGAEPEARAARLPDGRVFVFAFTDADALRSWAEGPIRWAAVRGPDLAAVAVESGAQCLALNPAGPFGGELNTAEVRALADTEGFDVHAVDPGSGLTSMAVRGDAGYELRPSTGFPSGLIEGVRRALEGCTDVVRAYPLESTIATGRRSYTVGLELAPEAAAPTVAAAICARLPAGQQLDVVALENPLREHLSAQVDPIWMSSNDLAGTVSGLPPEVTDQLRALEDGRLVGYPKRPLIDPLDEQLDWLVDRYISGDEAFRAAFRQAIGLTAAVALEDYGVRMASTALRDQSPAALLKGVTATMLAAQCEAEDPREVLIKIAPLHDSAELLAVDPEDLFDRAAELAGPDAPSYLKRFRQRHPESRSLDAFEWERLEPPRDGLSYWHRWWDDEAD